MSATTRNLQVLSVAVNSAAAMGWWANTIHDDFDGLRLALAIIYTVVALLAVAVALERQRS